MQIYAWRARNLSVGPTRARSVQRRRGCAYSSREREREDRERARYGISVCDVQEIEIRADPRGFRDYGGVHVSDRLRTGRRRRLLNNR